MADSAVAQKDDKKIGAIDLLKQSKDLSPVILYHFLGNSMISLRIAALPFAGCEENNG